MKYWGWFGLKLILCALGVYALWALMATWLPPAPGGLLTDWPRLGSDLGFTFAVGFTVIGAFGMVWATVADQVYRCRTCARRLRMPVTEGDFSRTMLGGTPHTEYICTYGHGKLYVPDTHLSSSRARRWTGYGSLWEDLMNAERLHRS